MSVEIEKMITDLKTEFNSTWADVKKMHDDLKDEKSTRAADVDTFKQADALRKEQLETMTTKLNELELTIARHKGSMKSSEEKLDKKTEQLWELYTSRIEQKADRDEIRDAIAAYAKHGKQGVTPDQLKLLSTQDNTNGGYLVVPEMESAIDKILADTSGVRQVARVTQTSTNVYEIVQRLTRPTVTVVGEGSNTARSNSTYGKIAIPNRRYTSRVAATVEEVADAMWSIEMLAREDVAEQFEVEQSADYIVGSGVNEPEGLWTNGDIVEVDSGAAEAVTYAGLIRVSHGDTANGGFNRNYHANARFAMNLITLGSVRLLEDTANQLIFQPNQGDLEATIAGFPYTIFPDAPSEGANTFPVMFGDFFKGYRIIDRAGMTILSNPYTYAEDGVIEYVFSSRSGGKVVNPSVLRKMKCST